MFVLINAHRISIPIVEIIFVFVMQSFRFVYFKKLLLEIPHQLVLKIIRILQMGINKIKPIQMEQIILTMDMMVVIPRANRAQDQVLMNVKLAMKDKTSKKESAQMNAWILKLNCIMM